MIRVSGPRAGVALEKMAGRLPEPRRARFGRLRDGPGGEVLDQATARFLRDFMEEFGAHVTRVLTVLPPKR